MDQDALVRVFADFQPQVAINCAGLVKQLPEADDPVRALPINSLFPHRLAGLCRMAGSRLIHLSTDCVFSGRKGRYVEGDPSDAEDLYGKSKYLGEVHDQAHVLTLRTSTVGHELRSGHGLVEWFLAQEGEVKGYSNAIFSGLATAELARVVHDLVLPEPALSGLYHLSARPIAKLDFLRMVADRYGKKIGIRPDSSIGIDRSLDSTRFREATGYVAPEWNELVDIMHESRFINIGS